MTQIEFVEYTERAPVLCMGDLIVKIDGKPAAFCWDYEWNKAEKEKHLNMPVYPPFWISGGSRTITDDGAWDIKEAPWELDEEICLTKIPPELKPLLPQLLEVMNENVPHGCCGGCL